MQGGDKVEEGDLAQVLELKADFYPNSATYHPGPVAQLLLASVFFAVKQE